VLKTEFTDDDATVLVGFGRDRTQLDVTSVAGVQAAAGALRSGLEVIEVAALAMLGANKYVGLMRGLRSYHVIWDAGMVTRGRGRKHARRRRHSTPHGNPSRHTERRAGASGGTTSVTA
jgi:hypothetical protein